MDAEVIQLRNPTRLSESDAILAREALLCYRLEAPLLTEYDIRTDGIEIVYVDGGYTITAHFLPGVPLLAISLAILDSRGFKSTWLASERNDKPFWAQQAFEGATSFYAFLILHDDVRREAIRILERRLELAYVQPVHPDAGRYVHPDER
ncbi:MAG: hypothetical protein K0S68_890 [Candidatus Saccharibacteria bacterium]|nr:hypothetical protein [Candidatus Saccharibacteria bacterium]